MTRIDIHRPSAPEFDPQAYTLVDVYDLQQVPGEGSFGQSDQQLLSRALESLETRGVKPGSHSWGCGHCGQTNLRYVALLVREDVSEWIFAGQDCLSGRFLSQTKASFTALRKAAELARATQVKKAAWLALCEEKPALAWASYADNIQIGVERELADLTGQPVLGRDQQHLGTSAEDHLISAGLSFTFGVLHDISRKARTYGQASDKQVAFVERLLGEIEGKVADYRAKLAAQASKPVVELVVQAGRQTVEGVVVSTKWVENDFGGSLKQLVELADGTRVYGTVPASIEPEKGDTVRFDAKVTRSDRDASFGFYSRPTKAEIVQSEEVVAA